MRTSGAASTDIARPGGPGRAGAHGRARGDLRTAILASAVEVFGERGYRGATTREIARRAGTAEGTVFNYFPTKREILVAMMEREVLATLAGYFEGEPGDDRAALEALFRDRIDLWRTRGPAFRAVLAEAFFDSGLADEMRRRVFGIGLAKATEFVETRVRSGAFRPCAPEPMARALVALALGAGLVSQMVVGGAVDPHIDEMPAALASLVLEGLSPDKPA